MGKPSAPAPPDPVATVNAQTASNKDTAIANANLNRIDQSTPYGNSTYSIKGYNADGTPQYSQSTTLSPSQQQLFDLGQQGAISLGNTAVGQLNGLNNFYSSPLNTSGLPGYASSAGNQSFGIMGSPGYAGQIQNGFDSGGPIRDSVANAGQIQGQVDNGDFAAQIKQAQDAAYQGQTQYLDPQFAQQGQSLDAKLANMGLQAGDKAYDTSQGDFSRQKQSAYQGARDAAIAAGNQEQNTLYGQRLQSGNFANQAQAQRYAQNLGQANFANQAQAQGYDQLFQNAGLQNAANAQQFSQGTTNANLQNNAQSQGLQQLFALRNQPLNEYNSLTTGTQVSSPTFNNVAAVNQAGTDVAGITNSSYQNQLAAFKQSQAGINNLFSLGGQLGGAAIMASDRRLKRDIKRVGETPSGIPLYEFSYKDEKYGVGKFIGCMADEVQPIIPNAVVVMADGFHAVDYSRVT